MLPVTMARHSSDSSAIRHVLSSFVNDIMCSHDRVNGPESQTMHMFSPARQVAVLERSLPFLTAFVTDIK